MTKLDRLRQICIALAMMLDSKVYLVFKKKLSQCSSIDAMKDLCMDIINLIEE